MPELPEVETVVRGLKNLIGRNVSEVELFSGAREIYDTEQLRRCQLLDVRRYGKYLLFDFSSDLVMVSHLRMTGQYLVAESEIEKEKLFTKHSHVLFSFDNGSYLIFNDQRRFGTIEVLPKSEVKEYFTKRKLGPDALLELPSFEGFSKLISKKKNMAIKTALLDQSVLLGLGNIYAQELCFIGKVNPRVLVSNISEKSLQKIHEAIVPLLKKAIEFNGTTFDGKYVDSQGDAGEFSKFLSVYGQKLCRDCGFDIKKIKLNGRGTYFCPNCQKS